MNLARLAATLTGAAVLLAAGCGSQPEATVGPEYWGTPQPEYGVVGTNDSHLLTSTEALKAAPESSQAATIDLNSSDSSSAPAELTPTIPPTAPPIPTPTPRQDGDVLDIMTVFPNEQVRKKYYQSIKGLITEEAYVYAYERGIDYNVELIGHEDFRKLFGEQGKRPDIIWWMQKTEGAQTLEDMEHATIEKTEDLFEFESEIRQWVHDGGVLIYSGNVHPAGFKRSFFPYGIELELHRAEDLPDETNVQLTAMGQRTLGANKQWQKYLYTAYYLVNTRGYEVPYLATYKNLERDWYVWGKSAGKPAMAAARYGEGSYILSQTDHFHFINQQQVAIGMLRAAIKRIHEIDPETSVPPEGVSPETVSQVERILEDADSGRITRPEAASALEEISTNIGKEAFGWIVANAPVYDEDTKEFTRFEDYAKELNPPKNPENPSRFEEDPVGTTIDLFLGESDTDKSLEWLGLNQD